MESVYLLHLLVPHPTQGVGGDVKVGQLLQEHREEVILLHLHWRERTQTGTLKQQYNLKDYCWLQPLDATKSTLVL